MNNKHLTMEVHGTLRDIGGQKEENNFCSKYRPKHKNPDPDI